MVNLSISGDSIVFEFINSNYYLQNGKIATPINSLALITDESNIATFKKSASADIFISASYTELGMSKAELIEWFKDNAVGETGGGGLTPEEAQEMIDESISGKADTTAVTAEISASVSGKADTSAMTTALADKADVSSLTAYFDGAEYNSTGKTIEFYNNGVLKDSIDATAFIKDGMVDTVSIEDITSGGTTVNCLVITFNTDSGKENINIPIKDIFDSDLYYTKTATDTLLDAKLNVSDFNTYSGGVDTTITSIQGDITDVQTALQGKASQTDLETVSGNVDTISGAVDTLSGQVADKADASDLANYVETSAYTAYTSATDTALQGKADASDLANYVETSAFTAFTSSTETALNGKQNTLTAGTNISISNDVISVTGITSQTVTSVTQAEFDALVVKDPDTFYIISDATGGTITIDPSLNSGSTNPVANSAVTTAIDTVSAATASNTTSINTINTQLGGYSIVKMTSAQYEALTVKEQNTIYFLVD